MEAIQPSDKFIDSLSSLNCITVKQGNFIKRQRSDRHKNSELLSLLRSFDQTKSSTFVRCLRKHNQKTVAKIIENGGGTE